MTVRVVTDSSASLPLDIARRLGIVVVPFNLVVNGVSYMDGELNLDQVVDKAISRNMSTSAPSPGAFAEAAHHCHPRDGAVMITVASTMSASYESAVLASRYFAEGQVDVVDSQTAAGAQGLVVLAAAERAALGAGREEVSALAREVAAKVRLVATVENLDFLALSGRAPAVAVRAGNSLGVRPLFEFSAGQARPRRPAIGIKAALDRIVTSIGPPSRHPSLLRVAILHAGTVTLSHRLKERIRATHPEAEIFTAPFSSVMTAHTGSGLVGAAWWRDESVTVPGRIRRAS